MASSWVNLIENGGNVADSLVLPPDETIKLSNNLQKIITFQVDKSDSKNKKVIRLEKTVQIISQKKRVSKNAQKRRDNWVKFGTKVSQIPKGQIEEGITTIRKEEWPFTWNEKFFGRTKKKADQTDIVKKSHRRTRDEIAKEFKEQEEKKREMENRSRVGRYRAPGLRSGGGDTFGDEKKTYDIRISNLPQYKDPDDPTQFDRLASRNAVKDIIRAFYLTELKRPPPQRYRVSTFQTRQDKETNAIVEFEREDWANKAIEKLNGMKYKWLKLTVEKSIPRKNRR